MIDLWLIIAVTWCAGLAAVIGAYLASKTPRAVTESQAELVHGVVAFGGGALLAAVAFALAPHAMSQLSGTLLAISFCAGGVAFCLLDAWLAKQGGKFANFLAMIMDYVPEALSLGAVFSQNHRMGFLLAAFIGLQNLPEGFNAFRELRESGQSAKAVFGMILLASFLGPLAGVLGYTLLQEQEVVTAVIMSFASGGIVYLVFQDIAPQATMRFHWSPPLGAVLGFALGMVGTAVMS